MDFLDEQLRKTSIRCFMIFSSPRQFWQLAVSTGFTVYCRGSRHVCMLFRGPSDCQLLRAPVAQTNSQVLGNAILHFGVYINRNTSIGNQLRLQFHWTHISSTPTKRWKRTKPNNLFHPQKIHFVDQISSCAVCTRWGLVLHLQGYPKHRMWDSWYVSNYFPDLNSVHDILTYDYSKDACSCPTGTQICPSDCLFEPGFVMYCQQKLVLQTFWHSLCVVNRVLHHRLQWNLLGFQH